MPIFEVPVGRDGGGNNAVRECCVQFATTYAGLAWRGQMVQTRSQLGGGASPLIKHEALIVTQLPGSGGLIWFRADALAERRNSAPSKFIALWTLIGASLRPTLLHGITIGGVIKLQTGNCMDGGIT